MVVGCEICCMHAPLRVGCMCLPIYLFGTLVFLSNLPFVAPTPEVVGVASAMTLECGVYCDTIDHDSSALKYL